MAVARFCFLSLLLVVLFSRLAYADDPDVPPIGVTHQEIVHSATGAMLETLPRDIVLVIAPPTSSEQTIFEVRHGGSYTRTASIYVPMVRQPRLYLRTVVVHYRTEDTETAARITRLIGRLLRLHREHFLRNTTFPRAATTAEVWVNAPAPHRGGDMGGEAWTHHIYLFKSEKERSPVEWVRTVVHEWGHLTLPAARGFASPETDASGFLGERLYFKWLNEDRTNAADDFVTNDGLDLYHHRQITPLIDLFHESGPGSPALKRTDTAGMDYYIAAALAADDAFGSRTLGRALFTIEEENPRELIRTLRESLQNSASFQVQLPAWVPLEAGEYRLMGDAPGSIQIADRPSLKVSPTPQTLTIRLPGWKWVRSVSGDTGSVTFRLTKTGGHS